MKNLQNKSVEDLLGELWDFSEKTEKLLDQFGETRLPIGIKDIAIELGFDIETEELGERDYGVVAHKTILVNRKLKYKEQRWVIAKAVAHFLNVSKQKEEVVSIPNPFFISNNLDEFYSDALAMLLLLPISIFKQEVSKNIDNSDLLQHLSDISQIPLFRLSIGYQLINQMLCFQRQKTFKECNYDITKFPFEPYENIFF